VSKKNIAFGTEAVFEGKQHTGHAILAHKNARQPRKTGFLPLFPDFSEKRSIVSRKHPIVPIILPIFLNIAILHGNGIQKANNTQGMLFWRIKTQDSQEKPVSCHCFQVFFLVTTVWPRLGLPALSQWRRSADPREHWSVPAFASLWCCQPQEEHPCQERCEVLCCLRHCECLQRVDVVDVLLCIPAATEVIQCRPHDKYYTPSGLRGISEHDDALRRPCLGGTTDGVSRRKANPCLNSSLAERHKFARADGC
jgi:hypothetical protein